MKLKVSLKVAFTSLLVFLETEPVGDFDSPCAFALFVLLILLLLFLLLLLLLLFVVEYALLKLSEINIDLSGKKLITNNNTTIFFLITFVKTEVCIKYLLMLISYDIFVYLIMEIFYYFSSKNTIVHILKIINIL